MNFRFNALLAVAILAAGPTFAGPKEDVLREFDRCAGIADDIARLACFDALIPGARAASGEPAAVATGPVRMASPYAAPAVPGTLPSAEPFEPVAPGPGPESAYGSNAGSSFGSAPPPQITPQQFGADQMPREEARTEAPREINSISARVKAVAFTPFGHFVVTLDNGQIWQQLQGDADRAHFRKNPKDNRVRISRGLLGSYNLTLNDSDKVFKVTRVK